MITTTERKAKRQESSNYALLERPNEHSFYLGLDRITLKEAKPVLNRLALYLPTIEQQYGLIDLGHATTLYQELLKRAKRGGNKTPDPLGFLGYLNSNEAKVVLGELEAVKPTSRDLADLIVLLGSGKAYDGNGKIIAKPRLTSTLNDITEQKDPWRGEWLDGEFSEENGRMHITYYRLNDSGVFEKVTEPLEECLMEIRRIDLKSLNRQGMPTREGNDAAY